MSTKIVASKPLILNDFEKKVQKSSKPLILNDLKEILTKAHLYKNSCDNYITFGINCQGQIWL